MFKKNTKINKSKYCKIRKFQLIIFFSASLLTILYFGLEAGQRGRESWQPPDKIMDAVGVKNGMIIGEAGAGSGYLTFPLAQRVGEKGKVYANDISSYGLETIQSRAESEGLENIEIVMGETEDPLFPEKNLDMIIMVYVLHHLEKPVEFLRNLNKYLKPGAPLVIVEMDSKRDRSSYPDFMSPEQVLETVKQSDFQLARTETFLPRDTIYIYRLKDSTASLR